MKTDALIERLSDGVAPVGARAAARTLLTGLGAGALASIALMIVWLGIRPDLMQAMGTASYWMKFFYTLLFALSGLWTLERLSRPGARADTQAFVEALPFVLLALLAAMQLMSAPTSERMPLMMGGSADVCPWRIAILALPIFAGGFWSLRKLAPTRPVTAGAAAGLAAGALGAFIYAFHCTESAMPFVALWYTFGIAAVGILGAVLGRWALRW